MAAILQVDVSSANRFVSSLSKSLQALCHGCMDFDTQIEIIGYLNVNIDCNGKVDCVLNEKVSKSEDNSMTFTSNSFLAKKDELKSLSDGSCSPIAELNARSHYQGKDGAHSNSSSLHYRSSGIFSPHSQIVRSAQKRPWRGSGWRGPQRHSAKSARVQEPHPNQLFQEGASQQNTSLSDTSVPNTYFDYSNSNPSLTDVCIKTEHPESLADPSHATLSSSDNQTAETTDINIKPDPDSANTSQSQFNFLQTTTDQNSGEQSFFKTEPVPAEGQNAESGTVEQSVKVDEENEGFSGAQADYDESEEQSHNQSMFGDESGDASQFDVIEIDDEDEDMDQFADGDGNSPHPTSSSSEMNRSSICRLQDNQGTESNLTDDYISLQDMIGQAIYYDMCCGKYRCRLCDRQYSQRRNAKYHVKSHHYGKHRYTCHICRKGFKAFSLLECHYSTAHGMPKPYECSECGKTFTRDYSLKIHRIHIHGCRGSSTTMLEQS